MRLSHIVEPPKNPTKSMFTLNRAAAGTYSYKEYQFIAVAGFHHWNPPNTDNDECVH
jgi:hypothetical protein